MGTNQNKQEQAYEWLKSRIQDGTYGPGYRLVIDRLAKEMGCSPIPVREAIRRLEAEGLVEYERFSGGKVTQIDSRAYAETLTVLAVLEGFATALAAKHLQASDIADLRALNEAMRTARSNLDLTTYSELNLEFHRVICEKCDHPYLLQQIRAVQERMNAVRVSVFNLIPHRTTDSIAEHEALLVLIESGADADVVERFARQHKLATLNAFVKWKEEQRK
ncbi:MAG: GntR family transcriptional regulator [Alicyclobacillaceae bacterium]|nr:GntR family transcriptional regulator [Alicyclobacillaceae bacterium]